MASDLDRDSRRVSLACGMFAWMRAAVGVGALAMMLATAGCSRFLHHVVPQHYVYVTAKEATLRDRFAAVSNRTGTVTNGERLVVLERGRRALRVKAPDGAVGWIEESMTADQKVADQFDDLAKANADDPVLAQATARDDVYMHIAPGRESQHFYRLNEGDTMSLLKRAVVAKPVVPGAVAPLVRDGSKPTTPGENGPVMEDWWLARTAKGQVGWVYGRMIDTNAPDALTRYSEGAKMIAAYVLTKVNDPDSGMINNGQTVSEIPEYVAVLNSYKGGLPYDFDEVRVFTWNTKRHRYETAFREKNIEGYLPVKIFTSKNPYGSSALAQEMLPTFQFRVLAANAPVPQPDAQTGLIQPTDTITKTYRLEDTICERVLPPGVQPPEEAHPEAVDVKGGKKRR